MSAAAMKAFGFEDNLVRVIDVDDAPWFVAQDVCACLEIANSSDAVASLDEDEKGVATTDTLGGMQQVRIISESGVYALIFRSRKTAAVRFRKWVTAEVLPTLRRTGRYVTPANDGADRDMRNEMDERGWMTSLAIVREARQLFGRPRARLVWAQLGLPDGREANAATAPPTRVSGTSAAVRDWLANCTRRGAGNWVAAADLLASHRAWCVAAGVEPENPTIFGLMLNGLGHISRKNGRGLIERCDIELI